MESSFIMMYKNNIEKMNTFVGDHDEYGEGQYGSTIEIHQSILGVIWGPAANIAILLTFYSYRKIWAYVHGSFFLFAIIITVASSIPIITTAGVIQQKNSLTAHFIIGIICFSSIIAVGILGILTKLLNICQAKSNTILLVRKLHAISGYVIVGLCKINLYIVSLGWIGQDIPFVIIFIVWKLYFPRMENKQISPKFQKNIQIRSIKSVKELDSEKSFVVFANYVYDTDPLKINHPAGYQIVEVVRNKEVDRYIYGSEVAAELPEVSMWSHSYKSFTLMDDPVARVNIEPTFDGFETPEVECVIPEIKLISQKGNIYQINLFKKSGAPFTFLGYKDISQIGRFYSISLNENVTRLYTTVNFLVDQNLKFLEKHLKLDGIKTNVLKVKQNSKEETKQETGEHFTEKKGAETEMVNFSQANIDQTVTSVPILFKAYPGGRFTQGMIKGPIDKVVLSESKGEGLELAHTKPGKIIMVIGGTGLYPFSDFIDLLYKEQLIQHNPSVKTEVLELNPILNSNPFAGFKFDVLAAFGHLQDIHPVTLQQLIFLAEKGRINLTFKFKENPSESVKENSHLIFTTSDFQSLLGQKMAKEEVSRVWICGPPKMNEGISKFLRQSFNNPGQYLII